MEKDPQEQQDSTPSGPPANVEYDLTRKLSPFMDLHFMFPLLEFLSANEMYSEAELTKSKLELLRPTNMVDYAAEVYQSLHEDEEIPKEFEEQRNAVLNELGRVKEECSPMLDLIDNEEEMMKLQSEKLLTAKYLEETHKITPTILEAFYRYAKLQYECGNYEDSLTYLAYYGALIPNTSENYLNALWGKLASEILMFRWEDALQDISRILELIESKTGAPLEQLQQRTWLLHWALFVFAWYKEGRDTIIDIMFQPRCLEAIQTNAPWLLRYLTTGVIAHKRRRFLIKQLMYVIKQEKDNYRDPIIEFVECMYQEFDFSNAQKKLQDCEVVLTSDFFLSEDNRADFLESARLFIFEIYCRLHTRIDLSVLASKLNIKEENAEKWIVELIRNARVDAKIDSNENVVIMDQKYKSIHQQVIDKSRDLAQRTSGLLSNFNSSSKDHKQSGRY